MKNNSIKLIKPKLFLGLTLTFVLFTIIGTISHELAHYFVGKQLGFSVQFHYNRVSYNNHPILEYLSKITKNYLYELKNNIRFSEKENYIKKSKSLNYQQFLFTIVGPIQTIITGTFGLVLFLIYKKKQIKNNHISLLGWFLIFLTLFWLRQIFNTITSLYKYFRFDKLPTQSDEAKINDYLNLPHFTTEFTSAFIGCIILFVILKNIPRKLILTFLLSGLIGGILGYYLWFYEIGKLIFP